MGTLEPNQEDAKHNGAEPLIFYEDFLSQNDQTFAQDISHSIVMIISFVDAKVVSTCWSNEEC